MLSCGTGTVKLCSFVTVAASAILRSTQALEPLAASGHSFVLDPTQCVRVRVPSARHDNHYRHHRHFHRDDLYVEHALMTATGTTAFFVSQTLAASHPAVGRRSVSPRHSLGLTHSVSAIR